MKMDDVEKFLPSLGMLVFLTILINSLRYNRAQKELKNWISVNRREKWMKMTNERFIMKGRMARINSKFVSYIFSDEDTNVELVKDLKIKLRPFYKTCLVQISLMFIVFAVFLYFHAVGFVKK